MIIYLQLIIEINKIDRTDRTYSINSSTDHTD